MADEHKLREERDRGQQAKRLVEHPLYVEAWDLFEERLWQGWRKSPDRDPEGRERLYQMLRAGDFVRRYIADVITTGKAAEMQLEDLKNG